MLILNEYPGQTSNFFKPEVIVAARSLMKKFRWTCSIPRFSRISFYIVFKRHCTVLTRNIFTIDEIDYLNTQWIIWNELIRLKYIFRDVIKKMKTYQSEFYFIICIGVIISCNERVLLFVIVFELFKCKNHGTFVKIQYITTFSITTKVGALFLPGIDRRILILSPAKVDIF